MSARAFAIAGISAAIAWIGVMSVALYNALSITPE